MEFSYFYGDNQRSWQSTCPDNSSGSWLTWALVWLRTALHFHARGLNGGEGWIVLAWGGAFGEEKLAMVSAHPGPHRCCKLGLKSSKCETLVKPMASATMIYSGWIWTALYWAQFVRTLIAFWWRITPRVKVWSRASNRSKMGFEPRWFAFNMPPFERVILLRFEHL